MIRTFWWSKRGAGGVLPSLIRTFSGSKRDVLEGSRGSYLRVLKVVRVWGVLDGFGRFWTVLDGFGGFWGVLAATMGSLVPPTRATNLRLEGFH